MSSKPLALPLEVLERILKLAFLPFVSSSSSSTDEWTEPTPPSSTSHLLLVSKGIRQISLPLFWRSITVTKSKEWLTFFDEDEGLFTAGEEGEERWEHVKEVRVDVNAAFPHTLDFDSEPIDFELPSSRRIPKVIFEHRTPPLTWNPPRETDGEPGSDSRGMELWDTLYASQPPHVLIPLYHWIDMQAHLLYQDSTVGLLRFAPLVEFRATGSLDSRSLEPALVRRTHQVFSSFRACLVGFPHTSLGEFETWMMGGGRVEAKRERWNSTWSWEREDGSTFFIDFSEVWS